MSSSVYSGAVTTHVDVPTKALLVPHVDALAIPQQW